MHTRHDKEFHHFFPKAFLKKNGIEFSLANVCANLIMPLGDEYLRE
ncbi:hypothetical protein LCL61_34480 [Amycolatopsis coloradensis]|uniref:Uncharacterized protein n=1 Tax=Amycolatopsis coloradensis TaxID=76021 RepID=A0ACD5BMY6_9PSEU